LKKPSAQQKPNSSWFQKVQNYYWLHDVMQIYVGLPTWVLLSDGVKHIDWMELTPQSATHLRPSHFDIRYGKEFERHIYYLKSIKRSAKEHKPFVDQYDGFYDFFLPLPSHEKRHAVLYSGFFLRQPPDWNSLAERWHKLTGRVPVDSDAEFVSYARMVLKLPVFDESLLKGVREFLQCYAEFLTGQTGSPPIYEKVDHLRRELFATRLPNPSWSQEALGLELMVPPPWAWYADKQLAPWMIEELGITRIPTTVFTVMPLSQGSEGADSVKTLIRNSQIQKECLAFVRKVPELVAAKLQDYGMVFMTSPDPNKSQVQARLQVRERAELVQNFLKKQFGLKSVAGIGRPVSSGDDLHRSYQEAVLALHLCVQTEKPLLFYDENPRARLGSVYVRLNRAAMDLLDAYEQASVAGIKLSGERYAREVLEFASGSVEVVRGQFLAFLFNFLERARKRSVLNPEDEKSYSEHFCKLLNDADSIYRLIDIFKETLRVLSVLAVHPLHGSKEIRMQTILSFLAENFQQTVRLPQVAKKSGFSVPVFCQVFKETTGLSFVVYLNKLRVEEAKSLLRGSHLNLLQVGQSCGFQTPHQFIRNFKRWTGTTPGDYRQNPSQFR